MPSYEEINSVRYFLCGGSYIVGDNSTSSADGISSTTYSGEITIEDRVNGTAVTEMLNTHLKVVQS